MSRALLLPLSMALSLSAPLALADDIPPILNTILVDSNTTWAGDPVKYLKTKYPKVVVQTSEFQPGAETIWHIHEVPAYIYVVSGTFRVELMDGRVQQWNAGQAFIEVVNTVHRGVNPGTDPAKLAIVFTGEEGVLNLTPWPLPDDKDKGKDKDKYKGHHE